MPLLGDNRMQTQQPCQTKCMVFHKPSTCMHYKLSGQTNMRATACLQALFITFSSDAKHLEPCAGVIRRCLLLQPSWLLAGQLEGHEFFVAVTVVHAGAKSGSWWARSTDVSSITTRVQCCRVCVSSLCRAVAQSSLTFNDQI